mmetsp:Transcript_22684/g.56204  ORF Transcript_22684/g.56204 Transcript_22684/m.56204 type:complete len:215 (-) Transcript_22684:2221-2865(-)
MWEQGRRAAAGREQVRASGRDTRKASYSRRRSRPRSSDGVTLPLLPRTAPKTLQRFLLGRGTGSRLRRSVAGTTARLPGGRLPTSRSSATSVATCRGKGAGGRRPRGRTTRRGTRRRVSSAAACITASGAQSASGILGARRSRGGCFTSAPRSASLAPGGGRGRPARPVNRPRYSPRTARLLGPSGATGRVPTLARRAWRPGTCATRRGASARA